MLIQKRVAQFLAERGIAHHHGDNMAEVIQMRHTNRIQAAAKRCSPFMQGFPFPIALPQMPYRGTGPSGDGGRQGS